MIRPQSAHNLEKGKCRLLALVGVARGDLTRDFRAFVEVSADGEIGGSGADPIGLLETAIATIEARHDLALRRSPLGASASMRACISMRHFCAVLCAAEPAQIMQRAEDLTQPRKIAIKGRRCLTLRASRHGETKENRGDGEQLFSRKQPV